MEATYHGVPILGMPVFGDQFSNVEKVVNEGYGEYLEWDDFTEDNFRDTIHQLLSNTK